MRGCASVDGRQPIDRYTRARDSQSDVGLRRHVYCNQIIGLMTLSSAVSACCDKRCADWCGAMSANDAPEGAFSLAPRATNQFVHQMVFRWHNVCLKEIRQNKFTTENRNGYVCTGIRTVLAQPPVAR